MLARRATGTVLGCTQDFCCPREDQLPILVLSSVIGAPLPLQYVDTVLILYPPVNLPFVSHFLSLDALLW